MRQTNLKALRTRWPEGKLYSEFISGPKRRKFRRYLYIVPRKATGVEEWSEAASYTRLDNQPLQVAWFDGPPSSLGELSSVETEVEDANL